MKNILLMVCTVLLLITVFKTDPSMVNGMVMGKVVWFHEAMVVFALSVCCLLFFSKRKKFRFIPADGAVVLMVAVVLLTYDRALNPEPEKLLFGGQLFVLWFLLRMLLQAYPRQSGIIILLLLFTALGEAVLGMMQLYGFRTSSHAMFRLTGTFYNPGPYSGYLAMLLPLCLGVAFATNNKETSDNRIVSKVIHYFAWLCVIAIVVVLPAGMSRSAWIAAGLSSLWVWWWYRMGWEKSRELWGRYRRWRFPLLAGVTLLLIGGCIGVYLLKKDSADGRLLMWKVSAKAIGKQPFCGAGLGGFPAAYAEAQATYFASGEATATEKLVAGCPEYAFNEYLQIGVEEGIGGLIIFLCWMGLVIVYGIRNKRYGIAGGVIALMVFAFSSYPLQLPSFWIVLVMMAALASTQTDANGEIEKRFSVWKILSLSLLTLFSFGLYWQQRETADNYRKWSNARMLYNMKAYEAAYPGYESLYPALIHKPEFLFEAGQCLSKMERLEESNRMFGRAIRLSADPMIRYILAKNKQQQQAYEEAEETYLYALQILPERIYPYYLLTKLYAEPAFYQPEKMHAAADSVLTKEPKVMTTAVKEMREEVKGMILE